MWGSKATTLKTAPVDVPVERRGPTPRDILEGALQDRTEVRLLFETEAIAAVGRVSAVDIDAGTVLLDELHAATDLRSGGVVVAFWREGRAFAFAGRVLGTQPDDRGRIRLLVELPSVLPRFETRACFRVPIAPTDRTTAWITKEDGGLLLVEPRDIGYGGALLEVGDADAAPAAGTAVRLTVRLDQIHIDVAARVRRVGGTLVRVIFSEAWRDGQLEPPPDIQSAVDAIQRRWLRQRVGGRE
jgi:hypothetical protein